MALLQIVIQFHIKSFYSQVRNGYCLALALRKFINDPYPEDNIGKLTPWRFVHYTYTVGVKPDPVKYRESLENTSTVRAEIVLVPYPWASTNQMQKTLCHWGF